MSRSDFKYNIMFRGSDAEPQWDIPEKVLAECLEDKVYVYSQETRVLDMIDTSEAFYDLVESGRELKLCTGWDTVCRANVNFSVYRKGDKRWALLGGYGGKRHTYLIEEEFGECPAYRAPNLRSIEVFARKDWKRILDVDEILLDIPDNFFCSEQCGKFLEFYVNMYTKLFTAESREAVCERLSNRKKIDLAECNEEGIYLLTSTGEVGKIDYEVLKQVREFIHFDVVGVRENVSALTCFNNNLLIPTKYIRRHDLINRQPSQRVEETFLYIEYILNIGDIKNYKVIETEEEYEALNTRLEQEILKGRPKEEILESDTALIKVKSGAVFTVVSNTLIVDDYICTRHSNDEDNEWGGRKERYVTERIKSDNGLAIFHITQEYSLLSGLSNFCYNLMLGNTYSGELLRYVGFDGKKGKPVYQVVERVPEEDKERILKVLAVYVQSSYNCGHRYLGPGLEGGFAMVDGVSAGTVLQSLTDACALHMRINEVQIDADGGWEYSKYLTVKQAGLKVLELKVSNTAYYLNQIISSIRWAEAPNKGKARIEAFQ